MAETIVKLKKKMIVIADLYRELHPGGFTECFLNYIKLVFDNFFFSLLL